MLLYADTYTVHMHKSTLFQKSGTDPSSTAQCTVWLYIHTDLCMHVFLCVQLWVQRSVSEGLGNAPGAHNQIPAKQSAICVYYKEKALGSTERKNISLFLDDCMADAYSSHSLPLAQKVFSISLPLEKSVINNTASLFHSPSTLVTIRAAACL